ncbi:MAG: hypothetical protein K2W95_20850 [Candidatus Obscuribacterales bacterium]|nr:hypothetical protein [Candidatus Obscuribacterales bacterium]
MNNLEMFVISGELKRSLVARSCRTSNASAREPWKVPKHFADSCDLLRCVRTYLDNEFFLFREAAMLTLSDLSILDRIESCASSLDGLLDDIVMLHSDEPDGSFAIGIDVISECFDRLLRMVRDSLALVTQEDAQPSDIKQLQVLMLYAA